MKLEDIPVFIFSKVNHADSAEKKKICPSSSVS